jgi:hypothetical protein
MLVGKIKSLDSIAWALNPRLLKIYYHKYPIPLFF